MDAVNKMMCQNWHAACVQEGNIDSVQQPLYAARAIQSEISEDGSILVNAGGSGYKRVDPTHDEQNHHRN